MIFVDEHARVYQNWEEFKANNEYPPGYIVAPTSGVYNTNGDHDSVDFNRVQLEVFPSSCVTTSSKLVAKAGNGEWRIDALLVEKFSCRFP